MINSNEELLLKVCQSHALDKAARTGYRKAVIIEAHVHGPQAGVVAVNQGIHNGLTKGARIVVGYWNPKQSHLDFFLNTTCFEKPPRDRAIRYME